jgi:hypothetical protein
MIDMTADQAAAEPSPVTPARPGLSTVASLLAIAAAVPLAVVLLNEVRVDLVLTRIQFDLKTTPDPIVRAMLLVVAMACLAGPVAAWLSRLLPPWAVLLGALLAVAVSYWRAQHVVTTGGLSLVTALQGAAAGALLASTAALVGAASLRTRPWLAGTWAAALIAAGAVRNRLAVGSLDDQLEPGQPFGWRQDLQPYRWLLAVAALCALLLAFSMVADRRDRLFPRSIDAVALLPLLPGGVVAILVLARPLHGNGPLAALVVLLVGGVAVLGAVAVHTRGSGEGRAAVGSATAAVAYVTAGAATATVAVLYSLVRDPLSSLGTLRGSLHWLTAAVIVAAVAAVAGAVAGALLPEPRRRTAILAGLVGAAAGAGTLLPASESPNAALPGLILMAGGCGLALAAVLRSVGPLATAVAGGLAAVAVTVTDTTAGSIERWRSVAVGGAAGHARGRRPGAALVAGAADRAAGRRRRGRRGGRARAGRARAGRAAPRAVTRSPVGPPPR